MTRVSSVERVAEYGGRVHYVKLLGKVGPGDSSPGMLSPDWNDEIHASDKGFEELAKEFVPVIDNIWAGLHGQ